MTELLLGPLGNFDPGIDEDDGSGFPGLPARLRMTSVSLVKFHDMLQNMGRGLS